MGGYNNFTITFLLPLQHISEIFNEDSPASVYDWNLSPRVTLPLPNASRQALWPSSVSRRILDYAHAK